MLLTEMKTYIARITASHNDTTALSLAGDSYSAAVQQLQSRHRWSFTLMETTLSIVGGTQDYDCPANFLQPYSLRLETNKRPLQYVKEREVDRFVWDQAARGVPVAYTLYRPAIFDATANSGAGTKTKIRLTPIPTTSENATLRYYRKVDPAATTIDLPDLLLYVVGDMARAHFLQDRSGMDERLPILRQSVEADLTRVMALDEEETPDEEVRFISQMEEFSTAPIAGPLTIWWK